MRSYGRVKRRGRFWIYIVECRDGTYYTGSTGDLAQRLRRHASGHGSKYVRGKRPIRLVYEREYRYYKSALNAERYLKRQTRRFKEALVRGTVKSSR